MTTTSRWAALLATLTCIAIAVLITMPARAGAVRYCDTHQCGSCDTGIDCGTLDELVLCCDYASGACSVIEFISDCDPEIGYAAICEHGMSLATGGIECFD